MLDWIGDTITAYNKIHSCSAVPSASAESLVLLAILITVTVCIYFVHVMKARRNNGQ